jgi:hypothetical protein
MCAWRHPPRSRTVIISRQATRRAPAPPSRVRGRQTCEGRCARIRLPRPGDLPSATAPARTRRGTIRATRAPAGLAASQEAAGGVGRQRLHITEVGSGNLGGGLARVCSHSRLRIAMRAAASTGVGAGAKRVDLASYQEHDPGNGEQSDCPAPPLLPVYTAPATRRGRREPLVVAQTGVISLPRNRARRKALQRAPGPPRPREPLLASRRRTAHAVRPLAKCARGNARTCPTAIRLQRVRSSPCVARGTGDLAEPSNSDHDAAPSEAACGGNSASWNRRRPRPRSPASRTERARFQIASVRGPVLLREPGRDFAV